MQTTCHDLSLVAIAQEYAQVYFSAKLTIRHYTQLLYHRETTLAHRLDILASIGFACMQFANLKSGSFESASEHEFTSVMTIKGQKLDFKPTDKFGNVVLYFFNPLIAGLVKWFVCLLDPHV